MLLLAKWKCNYWNQFYVAHHHPQKLIFTYSHHTYVDMIRWERRRDPQGRIYYVDHNTRTTTWQKPTTENVRNFQQWQQQEATNLEQRSQQHQQRFLVGGAAQPKDPSDDGLGALPDGWGQLIKITCTSVCFACSSLVGGLENTDDTYGLQTVVKLIFWCS